MKYVNWSSKIEEIFFLKNHKEKSYTKYGGESSPRPFYKNQN